MSKYQQIIDLELFKELTSNDAEFQDEVLQSFVLSCNRIIEDLKKSISANNEKNISHYIHSLKGCCVVLGFIIIPNIVDQQVNKIGKDKSYKEFLKKILEEFEKTKIFCKDYRKSIHHLLQKNSK